MPLFSNLCATGGGVNRKINIAHVWNGSAASSREPMVLAARKLPDSKQQKQQQQRKTSYRGFKLSPNIAARRKKNKKLPFFPNSCLGCFFYFGHNPRSTQPRSVERQ